MLDSFERDERMGQLRLTCFGTFQVTLNDAPLTAFQTDKVRALLVYLAVEQQAHQRSALAQLLWPGYTAESANTSLRQTLRRLRQLLGDDEDAPGAIPWLLITRQTVQFNPAAPRSVDVLTFTELLAACATHVHSHLATCQPCLARLRQAVDLYQGDFLSGFTVADSDAFEEWRRITQEQFHLQTLDALTHLAAAAENAGDDEAALQAVQRQLALEPWLEAAHRCVMRVLARRGQRAAAIAQYNRCCQVLAEEFGGEPDGETVALVEEIERGAFDKTTRRQDDKVTGWQGDKVTSRSEARPEGARHGARSVTLSPPHPVTPSSSLPVFLSPLIGRARALVEISNQLRLPGVRLLTLVGPGGMGKTRLAVAVGHEHLTTFADGVFFVPLAAISTPGAVAPAIATALGLPLQSGDPRAAVLHALRQKQLLLILDNFEHLLDEETVIELVVEILAAAPGVQMLVTSRERLNLRDEQLYPVQALALAAHDNLTEATAAAAVRLFTQAAQRHKADFQLTATNLAAVLRICRLVQGMPLGLELAAANVGILPLPEIADAIAQSAEFLAVDWRDLPQRQRSMRAVFTWSLAVDNPAGTGCFSPTCHLPRRLYPRRRRADRRRHAAGRLPGCCTNP
ncbi:MAG: BTAD domain-containing putative transcriptional regulator [Caldilineaceae bacterium]